MTGAPRQPRTRLGLSWAHVAVVVMLAMLASGPRPVKGRIGDDDDDLSAWAIALIAVTSVVGCLALVFCCIAWSIMRKAAKVKYMLDPAGFRPGVPVPGTPPVVAAPSPAMAPPPMAAAPMMVPAPVPVVMAAAPIPTPASPLQPMSSIPIFADPPPVLGSPAAIPPPIFVNEPTSFGYGGTQPAYNAFNAPPPTPALPPLVGIYDNSMALMPVESAAYTPQVSALHFGTLSRLTAEDQHLRGVQAANPTINMSPALGF